MTTRIRISKENLLHNISVLHSLLDTNARLSCCIKSNAYGHGLVQVGKILDEDDRVFRLNVFSLKEAVDLHQGGVTKQIQIFGPLGFDEYEVAIQKGFVCMVTGEEIEHIQAIAKSMDRIALVHLKVDTGMSRYGVWYEQAISVIKRIAELENVSLEGVYTHFATSEDQHSDLYMLQKERFQKVIFDCTNAGIKPTYFHCANSGAVILDPTTHLDMVRPGISIYGLHPDGHTKKVLEEKGLELKPVLAFETSIAQIHELQQGESVGYGATFTAQENMRVAILPIGYFDGFDRGLGNVGFVRIKGEVCEVIGRVSMNSIVVDVTHIGNCNVGDLVILIGEGVSADVIANRLETINYEVVTRLGEHIQRIVEK